MDAADTVADDRTFRVQFTGEGTDILRQRVNEKLREFMGDYTDDALVEYVIVLLTNGRRKDEARKELNVFLGDDCVSFVSWLWDHISSNIQSYAQTKETSSDPVAKTKPTRYSIELEHVNDSMQIDSEYDRERSSNVSRNRRSREWKGLVLEEARPFPLQSIVSENLGLEEKEYHRPDSVRSHSPRPRVPQKRRRKDALQSAKKEATSHLVIEAPRRLLQFAVRDALRTVQQANSRTELTSKRLRSVVSTSIADSAMEERPLAISSPGNVFDRLGHGIDDVLEREYGDFDQFPEPNHLNFYRNGVDTEVACDSTSDNDGCDDVNIVSRSGLYGSHSAFASKEREKLMEQYSVTPDADEVARKTWLEDQDQPRKVVNISVNVNTWKAPHYGNSLSIKEDEARNCFKKEVQKTAATAPGSYTAGTPDVDAISRTLFVSNVHFAATKDALSSHFNKFGEVLKVTIATDAATGQPKGSAYLEFLRKESAEQALSLNGTSFMCRILKVVRRSSVQHPDAAPLTRRPRIARASLYSSIPAVPFSRGARGGNLRARLPTKPGARSLQWKRGALTGGPTPTGRNLKYVRPGL